MQSPSQRSDDKVLDLLLKQCRALPGGPALIGKITRTVKGQEVRIAIVLADASPAFFKALDYRKMALAKHLGVDQVLLKDKITDPLVKRGLELGGFITKVE